MRDTLLKREQRRQGVWQKETNFLERENTDGGPLTLKFITFITLEVICYMEANKIFQSPTQMVKGYHLCLVIDKICDH